MINHDATTSMEYHERKMKGQRYRSYRPRSSLIALKFDCAVRKLNLRSVALLNSQDIQLLLKVVRLESNPQKDSILRKKIVR